MAYKQKGVKAPLLAHQDPFQGNLRVHRRLLQGTLLAHRKRAEGSPLGTQKAAAGHSLHHTLTCLASPTPLQDTPCTTRSPA